MREKQVGDIDAEASCARASELTSDKFSNDCSYYLSAEASLFHFDPPAREACDMPRINFLVAQYCKTDINDDEHTVYS